MCDLFLGRNARRAAAWLVFCAHRRASNKVAGNYCERLRRAAINNKPLKNNSAALGAGTGLVCTRKLPPNEA